MSTMLPARVHPCTDILWPVGDGGRRLLRTGALRILNVCTTSVSAPCYYNGFVCVCVCNNARKTVVTCSMTLQMKDKKLHPLLQVLYRMMLPSSYTFKKFKLELTLSCSFQVNFTLLYEDYLKAFLFNKAY